MKKSKSIGWQGFSVVVALIIATAGCSQTSKSDAYGQFEAIETTISAETDGTLLEFSISESDVITIGQRVGLVDTTQLHLEKEALKAQLTSVRSQIANINAQIEVQKEQLQIALNDLNRIQELAKDKAATQQQLDDIQGKVRVLRQQMDVLQSQKESVRAEIHATKARVAQIKEQISDARVINPVQGTVLNTYVEKYELVSRGQPLYQIASLDTLILRVYVSGAQLPSVELGQSVEVLVDKNAEENRRLEGTVSWVANEAEFTPKMIQTKEERVTQVYAVRVRVPNPNGVLKIGMPGEVNF